MLQVGRNAPRAERIRSASCRHDARAAPVRGAPSEPSWSKDRSSAAERCRRRTKHTARRTATQPDDDRPRQLDFLSFASVFTSLLLSSNFRHDQRFSSGMQRLRQAAYEAGKVHNLCECGGPLLVRYDLEKRRETWNRDWTRATVPPACGATRPCCRSAKPAAHRVAGRRHDAAAAHPASGRAARRERSVGEGRRPQSHRILQSPRPFLRHLDVRGTGH